MWRGLLSVSCAHLAVIDMIVTFRGIVKSQVEVIPHRQLRLTAIQ